MSSKFKISSSSSTPIKAKSTESASVLATPLKGSKYKNFLTAVLTPSRTKKWLKRNKSNKSEKSFKGSKADVEEDFYKSSQASGDFIEPTYSSIEELQLNQASYQESVQDSVSIPSTKFSENINQPSSQFLSPGKSSSVNTIGEPLYSTVNKQKKLKNTVRNDNDKSDCILHQANEGMPSELNSSEQKKNEDVDSSNRNLVEEQKEEIKLLVERMKELTKENRELRKNIESLIKEEKWKEDSLHAELKLKISQLEADTHKEETNYTNMFNVNCLSERITTLVKERKVLTEEIQVLHEEKKALQGRCEDLSNQIRSMVSPEYMRKIISEHEMLMTQIKKKHLEETKRLQLENESNLESKITLMSEVEQLRQKLQLLTEKNEAIRQSEKELTQEKARLLLQLEESKEMQQEAQNMLLNLLKIAESVSIERDVLLNKASFQDHQQKLLQSTMMDYSLNMGRLQEHISHMSKEKLEELQKLKSGESMRDESLKSFYGKQLDMLRSKVLNQNNTISDLESEKSKLELQLENLWQTACLGRHITGDVTYNS